MARPDAFSRWPAATVTTLLWGLAGASGVFWGLRLSTPPDAPVPRAVAGAAVAVPEPLALSRLLGGSPAETVLAALPAASSRFVLRGVVADRDGQGAALVAVDGKPARPFRVGGQLTEGYVLQSVTVRAATLGARVDGVPALTLQLPVPPMAIPGPARTP